MSISRAFDLKKTIIHPSSPRHSGHARYIAARYRIARRRSIGRGIVMGIFSAIFTVSLASQIVLNDRAERQDFYRIQSDVQDIRIASLTRRNPLPVAEEDPKLPLLIAYLQEKRSPLADYAGELSRMPNWKVLLGIAQAESNLCKKTSKNNCWGIGLNNTPERYGDISESMHYANYLMSKYSSLGMNTDRPETIVRTYVGYEHPGWVNSVRSVFAELEARGL